MALIRYPDSYNPLLEYYAEIESGKTIVSDKIGRTFKHLAYKVLHPDKYHYSSFRGNHIIEFAENFCRHSKGKLGGQPVRLELWEKAILSAIFGFIDDKGNRQYREAILIVAKKNGKSLLASIVGLYLLVADGEAGPEVYAVATKRDQAKIIWQESKRMVKKSPALKKRIKALTHELSSEEYNSGVYKPLASDSDTLDGLNVHCALMDEIHQWRNGRELFNIIADGVTAREQPLVFLTTTAGIVRGDVYDEKYEEAKKIINGFEDTNGYHDEHTIAFVYELDKKSEWTDPKMWYKANPGLGTIKNIDTLRAKVNKAKQNVELQKNLLCKEFNIPETSLQSWLSWEQLNNEATFDTLELKPKYGIGGCDLSMTVDLTAAKVLFKVPNDEHIYVLSMYWKPAELVEKHENEDKVPYQKWIDMGYMRTCQGAKIDPKCVTEWFLEIQNTYNLNILYTGYDAWSSDSWVRDMQSYFGKTSTVAVHQGKKTLSGPMKELRVDLENKLIVYNNNPVDKWCLANTATDEDINGNIQPHKTSKRTKRIDGTAALLDAYVVFKDKQDEYESLI